MFSITGKVTLILLSLLLTTNISCWAELLEAGRCRSLNLPCCLLETLGIGSKSIWKCLVVSRERGRSLQMALLHLRSLFTVQDWWCSYVSGSCLMSPWGLWEKMIYCDWFMYIHKETLQYQISTSYPIVYLSSTTSLSLSIVCILFIFLILVL